MICNIVFIWWYLCYMLRFFINCALKSMSILLQHDWYNHNFIILLVTLTHCVIVTQLLLNQDGFQVDYFLPQYWLTGRCDVPDIGDWWPWDNNDLGTTMPTPGPQQRTARAMVVMLIIRHLAISWDRVGFNIISLIILSAGTGYMWNQNLCHHCPCRWPSTLWCQPNGKWVIDGCL